MAVVTKIGGLSSVIFGGSKIFGVEWNYGASSPTLTRLLDAVGLSASKSIGSTDGSSGFSSMPIYKDIKLCNLADNGTVNAYYGDAGFKRDGSNGQVMVEIPAVYYKAEKDTGNTKHRFWITDKPYSGFSLHPAFQHNGTTQSKIYIAAYKISSGYTSKTGQAEAVSLTRAEMRSGIVSARGSKWSLVDAAVASLITLLMIIEWGTLNGQSANGLGVTGVAAAINTGGADGVVGAFGRASGTDGETAIMWRGIENWWGNLWEYVDGMNVNNGELYYCLTQSNFADDTVTNYTTLNITHGSLSAYGTALGYHANTPWGAFPSAASDGSDSTYLCDNMWANNSGWRTAIRGQRWDGGNTNGPFAWYWSDESSGAASSVTGRMMCIP